VYVAFISILLKVQKHALAMRHHLTIALFAEAGSWKYGESLGTDIRSYGVVSEDCQAARVTLTTPLLGVVAYPPV
jgi:hypothetical protein